MKTIKMFSICLALLIAPFVHAQDTNAEIKGSIVTFIQNVTSNKSLTLALYPSYAPSIVVNGKKDTFGLGFAALTPVAMIPALSENVIAQHSYVGLRFDYLAHEAFASTVGVGMRGDFQLWGHNFDVFAQTGANIPFAGFGIKNGEIGAMAGGGGYTSLWTFTHGSFGLQISVERWTQFSGYILHGGPVLNVNF